MLYSIQSLINVEAIMHELRALQERNLKEATFKEKVNLVVILEN
jgi:hypothetical protein